MSLYQGTKQRENNIIFFKEGPVPADLCGLFMAEL